MVGQLVEQPLRKRKVVGLNPTLVSDFFAEKRAVLCELSHVAFLCLSRVSVV